MGVAHGKYLSRRSVHASTQYMVLKNDTTVLMTMVMTNRNRVNNQPNNAFILMLSLIKLQILNKRHKKSDNQQK